MAAALRKYLMLHEGKHLVLYMVMYPTFFHYDVRTFWK